MRTSALLTACACMLTAVASSGAAVACRDTYQQVMAGAAAEWPRAEPFPLPVNFARYFMVAYNAEVGEATRVEADTIIVVPLDSSVSGTWWFFGFKDACLTFYADLGRTKGYHLIEQGHAMLYPNEPRIEDWR